jgi:endonuclease/exonuclease/phosphatase (EEP) superfamily protein YafD
MNYLRGSILLRLAALGTLLAISGALTFGYLGWLHPAFDSFSHFRIHLAAGLFVAGIPLLLLFRYWPEAIFAALFSVTTIVQTIGLPLPSQVSPVNASATPHAGAVYRLLHMNLRYDNPTPEAVFSLIGREKPDIITMNEVSAYWVEKLAILKAAYPYQLICPPPAYIGGTAIVSRRPFAEGFTPECGDRGSFGHVSLDMNGRTLEVASLHLGWPWPFEQPWQLPHVEPLLGAIDGTAIIAGDLNAVPWSQTAKRVTNASGTELLRGVGPTYLDRRFPAWMRPLIGLPIDNMMAKGGIVPVGLTRMEAVGSDHLPILFEFMLMPQEQPASVLHADAGSTASKSPI